MSRFPLPMRVRILFVSCSIASLLFICTSGALIRSYFVSDEIKWFRLSERASTRTDPPSDLYWVRELSIGAGRLCFARSGEYVSPSDIPAGHWRRGPVHPVLIVNQSFWAGYGFDHFGTLLDERWVFPLWPAPCLALCVTILLIWRLRKNWQRHRFSYELRCLSCGYDLRATPHRCPECGWPIPNEGTSVCGAKP